MRTPLSLCVVGLVAAGCGGATSTTAPASKPSTAPARDAKVKKEKDDAAKDDGPMTEEKLQQQRHNDVVRQLSESLSLQ